MPFVAARGLAHRGRPHPPAAADAPLANALDGWSRGVEVMLQRRAEGNLKEAGSH